LDIPHQNKNRIVARNASKDIIVFQRINRHGCGIGHAFKCMDADNIARTINPQDGMSENTADPRFKMIGIGFRNGIFVYAVGIKHFKQLQFAYIARYRRLRNVITVFLQKIDKFFLFFNRMFFD
jgi:hypothetical protein